MIERISVHVRVCASMRVLSLQQGCSQCHGPAKEELALWVDANLCKVIDRVKPGPGLSVWGYNQTIRVCDVNTPIC